MKLICQQSDLLAGLTMAARAAAARSTVPTLECVLLEAGEDGLRLTCTDLAMGIETGISASIEEEGRLLLPARLLLEIVRKLPEGEVSLHSGDNLAATLRCRGSRTTLQGMPADEFPALPDIPDAEQLVLPQSALREMIRQSAFAVAVEETRPILTGVLVEAEGDQVAMVALDGFRLALRRGKLATPATGKISAVIPGKCMGEVARMLGDEDGEVALGFGRTHVAVNIGSARVTVRLLEGEYIKYQQLIPAEQKLTALVERGALAECVDRASLMAREGKNNLIRLHLDEERMSITSNSELGDIYEELPIELTGQALDIAFNVRYVSDALRNLSDEKLLMRFTSAVSPCVLTPVEGDAYLYLLLPVRVYGA